MNHSLRTSFWIFTLWTLNTLSSQEPKDYEKLEFTTPEYFLLTENTPLVLNNTYCLQEISAAVIPSSVYGNHYTSPYFIRIKWKSKTLMTSITMESDSVDDPYCDAKNKHYYYRKPLNQTFHDFPDDVNEGIRFPPIKLNCRFVITPKLDGFCPYIKLRYTTPVCINNETCSCKDVYIPGPVLEAELEKNGVTVFWSFPKGFKEKVSWVILSIYSEDGINIKMIDRHKIPFQNNNYLSKFKFKKYFQVNTTADNHFRIQGYFENKLNCHGNLTYLRFRHASSLVKLRDDKLVFYGTAVMFLLLFIILTLLFFWKKPLKIICKKVIRAETPGFVDVRRQGENCKDKYLRLPPMVRNKIYKEQSRDPYLIYYRDLDIKRKIASGNFGVVYLANSSQSIKGNNEFAIKQIKDKSGPEGAADFMDEINMFKRVGSHPNVVKMFGYCAPPEPLTIIMEYVPHNLLLYLKNLRETFEKRRGKLWGSVSYDDPLLSSSSYNSSQSTLSSVYISQNEVESAAVNVLEGRSLDYVLDHRELEIFGLQIAKGMAHLEGLNIVHRDLAARNILMDNFKNLKISDFGMSRTGVYVNTRSRKFPLRWMSPEALLNRTYSNKSDVWAFGVVLWEIGTLGAFPYPTLQNEEVISLLGKGGHLEKPENVTSELYRLMIDCWAVSPNDRPTFKDLVERIEGFCQKSNGYVRFENLKFNYVFPPMEEDLKKVEDFSA